MGYEEEVRSEFLDIIKYYNDVVMTSPVILGHSKKYELSNRFFKGSEFKNLTCDKRNDFFDYIIKKNENVQKNLNEYTKTLVYFYKKYKKYYDNITIFNIILSTSLPLFEMLSLMFVNDTKEINVLCMCISTLLAISTSALKVKNYKEKIEDIVKVKEKVYACQGKIFTFDKKIKSWLCLSDTIIKNSTCNNNEHTIVKFNNSDGGSPRSHDISDGEFLDTDGHSGS